MGITSGTQGMWYINHAPTPDVAIIRRRRTRVHAGGTTTMMSPGFVDLMLFLVLISFTIKGWVTGFIRSVVTVAAVCGGWFLSGMIPDLTSPILVYSIPLNSPYHDIATRITTFILAFGLCQVGGFTLTGLIENIKMGSADKIVGLGLGIFTGVMAGSMVVSIFFTHPDAYYAPAGQRYLKSSLFFKSYVPMVTKFVKKPRRPSAE
jgi:uncharacterized membrane protein required for colicin V production